jgi:hypothetical protein
VVLLMLSALLIIQAHAVLTLASELFQLQARRNGVTPPFDGSDASPPDDRRAARGRSPRPAAPACRSTLLPWARCAGTPGGRRSAAHRGG